MACGTQTANYCYLAFVTRCSAPVTIFGALWFNGIPVSSTLQIWLGDSIRSFLTSVSFSKSKYLLIVSLVRQSILTLAIGSPLHKECLFINLLNHQPPIRNLLLSCHSPLITHHRFRQTHNLLPSLPIASLSNVY